MKHGTLNVRYDKEKRQRVFTYVSVEGPSFEGVFDSNFGRDCNYYFHIEGVGAKKGSSTYEVKSSGEHCCGAQGFSLSLGNSCPACESSNRNSDILNDITFLLGGEGIKW